VLVWSLVAVHTISDFAATVLSNCTPSSAINSCSLFFTLHHLLLTLPIYCLPPLSPPSPRPTVCCPLTALRNKSLAFPVRDCPFAGTLLLHRRSSHAPTDNQKIHQPFPLLFWPVKTSLRLPRSSRLPETAALPSKVAQRKSSSVQRKAEERNLYFVLVDVLKDDDDSSRIYL
jgi:hypothetical protein